MTVPLVIDIETARTTDTVEDTIANMKLVDRVDSRLKDENKIQAAWAKKACEAGLDASHGRVVAIGTQFGDFDPYCLTINDVGGSEAELLGGWVEHTEGSRLAKPGNPARLLLVGHRLIDFDLPFIWRRMIINGLKPPHWLPRPAALSHYWDERIYDTAIQWAGTRGYITLKKLAWTLGVEGKTEGIDGSQVQALVDAGEWETIREYCLQDVRATRACYDRMTTQS